MKHFVLLLLLIFTNEANVKSQSWQRVQLIPDTAYSPDMWGGKLFGDTAIIMGGYGYLFYSTDYLRTYSIDSSFSGKSLYVMAFANRDTGYITVNNVQGGLLRTTNGGENWYPLPYGPPAGAEWGDRLSFGTNNLAYSTDTYGGGTTVDRIDINNLSCYFSNVNHPSCYQLIQVRAVNNSIIYVLYNDALSPYNGGVLSVMRSEDSAKTWNYKGYTGLSSSGDMWAIDDTTAIVVGGYGIAKSVNFSDSFYITLHVIDAIPNYKNAIYFVNHDTGFVAFPDKVYKTYDAGDSWTMTDFAFDSTDIGNHINFITATSSQKIIVGCAFGNIYKTENGGGVYTGVKDVNPQHSFTLYPNPTSGQLKITPPIITGDSYGVEISNVLGQTVFKAYPNNNEIDISNLASGIYLLRLEVNGVSQTAKLVKQ